jgi:uncharacterized DUF497 family protein
MFEDVAGYDWDDGNESKCRKHGLTRKAIEEVFRGQVHVFPDIAHSSTETRYLGIGRTRAGRCVFVSFTFRERRGRWLIRPISARFMHAKEVKHYETQIAKLKK